MMRFLYALRFLTVLPLPYREGESLDDVARSIIFFPLVGSLIGLFLWGIAQVAALVWSLPVTATLVVAAGIMATGGLHWDGGADLADGLGGGRDRESRLSIMKDSSIGTFGGLFLILGILLKVFLVWQLLDEGLAVDDGGMSGFRLWIMLSVLVLMPTLARMVQVGAIFFFPYARREGMGTFFKERMGVRHVVVSLGWTLALLWGLAGWAGILLFGVVGICFFIAGAVVSRRLGGLTGDVYGAFTEGAELLFLLVFLALPEGIFSTPLWKLLF